MKLNLEQIKSVAQGVQNVECKDGGFVFLRFTEKEAELTGSFNAYYPAGVQLIFKTDGDLLRLKVFTEGSQIRGYFSFDIFENDKLKGSLKNIEDSEITGNYASKKYLLGEFDGEFKLTKGEKTLRIVLPHSVFSRIQEIEIENATFITPIKREKILITYGDSITQGYDSVHPSNTYAMRLAEALGAELFNKGIGGAQFMPSFVAVPDGLKPDLVTVAYGTNDWNCVTLDVLRKTADGFFNELVNKYPNVPIFAISPIWRKDFKVNTALGDFFEVEKLIKEVCEKYESVRFISGLDLVPHDENCFGDLNLHPNDKGFEYYFENLIKSLI